MIIKDIFAKNINRPINGVVKVGQDDSAAIAQEVSEYVITKELRKHLLHFFNFYYDSFSRTTDDVGVWLSGHFGSGKSHLLKMMSYLLDNKNVIDENGNEKCVLEYFREKFDDNAAFFAVEKSVNNPTETILFNIDAEGSVNKDKTAVLRVFAKVFYNHLGFYGSDLKIALLEKHIDGQGKTEEFRRVFEEKKGSPWISCRKNYKIFKKYVAAAMAEVLGTSEADALDWIKSKEDTEFSITELVEDIQSYVKSKPKKFRLLFMADEVGQYAGGSTDLLLNLQTLVEAVGTKCHGSVWIVCTGQEAVDELIKARMDMFAKIQDRFKTRLVLTSSSAEEVIRERILKKKSEHQVELEALYRKNDSVLKNLFTFTEAIGDMTGFSSAKEFASVYPFPKYQFIVLHKVFEHVRKSGNASINMAVGARSMLSGFKEAAQKVQERNENALVPFYLFYDTVHGFLSNTIRSVVERCQRAAENHHGVELQDVNVLKLLYLIRYIDDIKASVDNITILMADDIGMDKIVKRREITESLDRLLAQNYIGKNGNYYNFLTDEEQEIARDIRVINVDGSQVSNRVADIIYDDIYSSKKFSMGPHVFAIDRMIDNSNVGLPSGGLVINVLTMADDPLEKTEFKLTGYSADKIIVVLPETSYYEALEQSEQIRQYVERKNVNQYPESVQNIIKGYNEKANNLRKEARADLEIALTKATFYIAGEKVKVKGATAKEKLNQAFEVLVERTYTNLNQIKYHYKDEEEIRSILKGIVPNVLPGMEDPNEMAMSEVKEYLGLQENIQRKTFMSDIHGRFSKCPYGWRDLDIVGVVAMLIQSQSVVVKRFGETVMPNNPDMVMRLRKKNEIANTQIAQRRLVSAQNMRAVINFLREYYSVMDVPDKEDDILKYAADKFENQLIHYESLLARYTANKKYPDKKLLDEAVKKLKEVLSFKKDNVSFVNAIIKNQENMWDSKEDLEDLEGFFENQVELFDDAVNLVNRMQNDNAYIKENPLVYELLNKIRKITVNGENHNVYSMIPELNGLMPSFEAAYGYMLADMRDEVVEVIEQCEETIFSVAANHKEAIRYKEETVKVYNDKRAVINRCDSLIILEGMKAEVAKFKDKMVQNINIASMPSAPKSAPKTTKPAIGSTVSKTSKKQKKLHRLGFFEQKILCSEEEINAYVEGIRKKLLYQLKDVDEIRIE